MAREIRSVESYRNKLLKLIPSEIVAAYMVIIGIIPKNYAKWGTLIVAIILLILTPFYLKMLEKVTSNVQVVFCSLSFVVWIYSLGGMGGPFMHWNIYQPWIGSVVLILWTLMIPMFVKPKT
jgi:hypothetical protein